MCGLPVANLFASGSCDGVVLLWSTSSLSAMKMFHCVEGMPKELPLPVVGQSALSPSASATSLTEIKHILVIGEVMWCAMTYRFSCPSLPPSLPQRYLFAAIGCGFKVYDVLTYEGKIAARRMSS